MSYSIDFPYGFFFACLTPYIKLHHGIAFYYSYTYISTSANFYLFIYFLLCFSSLLSRYVLVAQPEIKQPRAQATAVEETLLMLRFPKSRVRRRHNSATISGVHANRNVRARTIFEM